MDITEGSVVRSKAGRDKGRFFVVLSLEDQFVYLADGDLRKISKPKRKKLMHVLPTKTVFSSHQMSSDKMLYRSIREQFSNRPLAK